jgi:hypothetical protein
MTNDTTKQWTIEPKLQEFIDRKMVIAQATFAKDSDEQVLRNTTLLFLAGVGLVRAENTNVVRRRRGLEQNCGRNVKKSPLAHLN